MGGGNGKIKREIEELKRDRERREREHAQMIDSLNQQLENAKNEREAAMANIRDLTQTLERERQESAEQIKKLREDQERLIAKVEQLMAAFKRQEAMYQQQLAEARAENLKLTAKIDQLLNQLATERAEHQKEMADFRDKSEALVKQLMEDSARSTDANRELLDQMKKLLADKAKERARRSVQQTMTSQENHKRQQEIEREIARAEKLLNKTINWEIQSVVQLVKDQPMAGILVHKLALDLERSDAGAGTASLLTANAAQQPIAGLAGPTPIAQLA